MSLQNWKTNEVLKETWCTFQSANVNLQEYGASDSSSWFTNLKWLKNSQGNWVLHMQMEIKQAGWFYIQKQDLQSSNCVRTGIFCIWFSTQVLSGRIWGRTNLLEFGKSQIGPSVLEGNSLSPLLFYQLEAWQMKDVSSGEGRWATMAGNNIRKDQHVYGVE